MATQKNYNRQFYNSQLTQSGSSANYIVPIINSWFKPKTVVDVGCGVGAWLEVWKIQSNICEIKGLDARFIDKSLMRIDIENEFIESDLNNELPKLKRFDLAMCLEVAEHLEEKRANTFVEDLTKLSDIIVFSAAIPGQEGTQHINEQFLKYWISKFSHHNYKCFDVLRPIIWDVDTVAWWFRQNIVVFVRDEASLEIDLNAKQSFNCFDLVQKDLLQHKDNEYKKLLNKEGRAKKNLRKLIKRFYHK